ncbi:hypothetical protein KCH_48020 [Kitasatospora cheerisanensis KCTC 2395]|uniref:Uncharacterized protein n=1 Tax=Kitasatospora cheerisanensis KCTC 2395 TaxID=1348663 RepID=A0A066YZH8_9ACTN|nr:hypothetical protein KCH_48020 [Kitasatospora cheerisanensis KCTC 2395]
MRLLGGHAADPTAWPTVAHSFGAARPNCGVPPFGPPLTGGAVPRRGAATPPAGSRYVIRRSPIGYQWTHRSARRPLGCGAPGKG